MTTEVDTLFLAARDNNQTHKTVTRPFSLLQHRKPSTVCCGEMHRILMNKRANGFTCLCSKVLYSGYGMKHVKKQLLQAGYIQGDRGHVTTSKPGKTEKDLQRTSHLAIHGIFAKEEIWSLSFRSLLRS